MKKILYMILVLLVFGQTPVMANEWQVDPAHSGIMFDVKHIYSVTRGYFSDYSGKVFFDPDNPEKSRFDFSVKVDSINTGIGKGFFPELKSKMIAPAIKSTAFFIGR